jgi:hypothetical protein
MQALKPKEIYILHYVLICEMKKVEKLQHFEDMTPCSLLITCMAYASILRLRKFVPRF